MLHVNKYFNGSLKPLTPDETITISTGLFLAFGKFTITATVKYAGEPKVTKTVDGVVLFFYVIIK
jgi:hypothetical protein